MPRGHERILIYLREQDHEGRTILRAVEAPQPPPGPPPRWPEEPR